MPFRHAFHVILAAALISACASRGDPEPSAPASTAPPIVEPPRAPAPLLPPAPEAPPSPTPAPAALAPTAVAPVPETKAAPTPAESRMSIAEAQKRLTELRYRPGAIDGQLGARTVAALRQFQRDQRLRVTGALDTETIQRLRTAKRR